MTHLSDKATDKEVLQAAMQKVIENGWDAYGWPNWQVWGEDTVMFYDKTQEIDDTKWVHRGNELELSTILFDHEFCKALWGEARDIVCYKYILEGSYFDDISVEDYERLPDDDKEGNWFEYIPVFKHKGWQYHGTQMFLAEDRIDYLRKYLDV